jgi:SAM-dependent methyltransferase
MSTAQHTPDWEARYRAGDTPWDDDVVPLSVIDLFGSHVPRGAHVLEVGCGSGTTALWLAQQGYRVVACDVSAEAIRIARQRAAAAGLAVSFRVLDVLTETIETVDGSPFEVVFSRGVLHTFTAHAGRLAFAEAIARCLPPDGLWLDVAGSADTADPPGARARLGLPRLSLAELAAAVEPSFAVESVQRCRYGTTPGRTDFLGWSSVLRRR